MAGRLSDVELERTLDAVSTTPDSLYRPVVITFVSFLIFQSTFVYAAFKYPSLVNTTVIASPITPDYTRRLAEVKIRIDSLTPLHQFVSIAARLTRSAPVQSASVFVNVNKTIEYWNDQKMLDRQKTLNDVMPISFPWGVRLSTKMTMLDTRIQDFTAVNVSIRAATDLANSVNFLFKYSFADQNIDNVMATIRLVLSGCSLYAFLGFLYCLKDQGYFRFMWISLLSGISAIFATNPFGVFNPRFVYLNDVTNSIFLTFYRTFCILLLQSTIHKTAEAAKTWTRTIIPLVVVYGFVEGLANKVVQWLHIGYLALICALLVYGARGAVDVDRFQLNAFGSFMAVTCVMAIIAEVWMKDAASSLSLLLYQSSHVLASIVFLFLQQSTAAGYQSIDIAPAAGDSK
jgi:hypothetical protein